MTVPRTVACPICGKRVEWTLQATWRPFCSERCKLIDFGAWANESYRIPVVDSDQTGEPPPEDEKA